MNPLPCRPAGTMATDARSIVGTLAVAPHLRPVSRDGIVHIDVFERVPGAVSGAAFRCFPVPEWAGHNFSVAGEA